MANVIEWIEPIKGPFEFNFLLTNPLSSYSLLFNRTNEQALNQDLEAKITPIFH